MVIEAGRSRYPFLKSFGILFSIGLAGVVSSLIFILPQVDDLKAANPALAEVPAALLPLMLMMNPLLLLAAAAAVGTWLAPRVGLRSLLVEKVVFGSPVLSELRRALPTALTLGLLLAPVILFLDWLMMPLTGLGAITDSAAPIPFSQLLMGLLYGGITEEILLRWGFMSLLVWVGGAAFQRSQSAPKKSLVVSAIFLAAVLFGIAHLPAMSTMATLTGWVVFRTVMLNTLGGVVYGWVFWRYNLETAMIAHASTHIGFFLVSLILSLVL